MYSRLIKPSNALVAGYSYLKSSFTGNPAITGMPLSVSVELTNHCNLHCSECASGSDQIMRGRGYMDPELYGNVIGELRPYLYYVNLYFQGEPMLHPQFFSFIGDAGNIRTIVSTNGHFLSNEYAEKLARSSLGNLIVSLDGMDQEIYAEYRKNGDFNTVIEGIKNISEARYRFHSRLKLEIQFLVSSKNEHQIPQVKQFAKEVKASLRLKSMQVINGNDIGKWMPDLSKFRRYKEVNGKFILRNSLPDRCMRLWFNPVITWDGKVVPCCFV